MKWISVKEKLQEEGDNVLAFMYNIGEHYIAYLLSGKWYDITDLTAANPLNNITHWMDLPEGPKEVSERKEQ